MVELGRRQPLRWLELYERVGFGEELAIADCKRFRHGKFQRVKFENGA